MRYHRLGAQTLSGYDQAIGSREKSWGSPFQADRDTQQPRTRHHYVLYCHYPFKIGDKHNERMTNDTSRASIVSSQITTVKDKEKSKKDL
jgi:hypothetical protein